MEIRVRAHTYRWQRQRAMWASHYSAALCFKSTCSAWLRVTWVHERVSEGASMLPHTRNPGGCVKAFTGCIRPHDYYHVRTHQAAQTCKGQKQEDVAHVHYPAFTEHMPRERCVAPHRCHLRLDAMQKMRSQAQGACLILTSGNSCEFKKS